MMDNYGTPPVALVRGEGATVWDADGKEYVDLIAGIAVSALGHAHPELRAAVDKQMSTLGHVSNLFLTEPGVLLAERLLALLDAGDGRVFFCNSGAEANEAALKLARRHGRDAGGEDKLEVVAAVGSFHGRTFGALAVTGQPAKRTPFEPLPGPVTFVPYGDAAALSAAVTERTAAVILEPVLGEGGVQPAPEGYLLAARAATRAHGALLIMDEVQTGVGRTGAWFAHTAHGLVGPDVPDVVTLAKGLGGGLPIGACIGLGTAGRSLRKGDHGTTYGGNPVVSAAALAVLDVIVSDGLLEHVRTVGARLVAGIRAVDAPLVAGVRGSGLLLAIVLTAPAAPAVELAARQAGFLVNAVAPDAIRLAPPLVLSAAQADAFVDALPAILAAATPAAGPTA
ncbi:MAG: acetylornithine transaminase [Actinomycetota bacterium]|nr:acetylornithine transaminase [Actinomycetota bacterium]